VRDPAHFECFLHAHAVATQPDSLCPWGSGAGWGNSRGQTGIAVGITGGGWSLDHPWSLDSTVWSSTGWGTGEGWAPSTTWLSSHPRIPKTHGKAKHRRLRKRLEADKAAARAVVLDGQYQEDLADIERQQQEQGMYPACH
jgi:hypothetical protein